MKQAVYLLGAPGVGKSTLMAHLLKNVTLGPETPILNTLRGHFFENGVYVGKMREAFPGTDGLAMSVARYAEEWAAWASDGIIVGEGARLGYPRFLETLKTARDLTLIHLHATQTELAHRRDMRGSTQNEQWMRGAETRARNAYNAVNSTNKIEVNTTGLNSDAVLAYVLPRLTGEVRKMLRWENA